MQAGALGLIRVMTPGTPVALTTNESLRVMQIVVRTVPGFTGRTYLGLAGMDKASAGKTGVLRVLSEPPAWGPQDGEAIPPAPLSSNAVRVADYYIDADVAGEGVMVTYYQN